MVQIVQKSVCGVENPYPRSFLDRHVTSAALVTCIGRQKNRFWVPIYERVPWRKYDWLWKECLLPSYICCCVFWRPIHVTRAWGICAWVRGVRQKSTATLYLLLYNLPFYTNGMCAHCWRHILPNTCASCEKNISCHPIYAVVFSDTLHTWQVSLLLTPNPIKEMR